MDLRREPALLLITLLAPIVQAVAAFIFEADPATAGVVNAAAVAVAGALTAFAAKSDDLLPAITGAATALLALGAAFGLNWSTEQQALVLVPITMIAGYVVRKYITAPVDVAGNKVAHV